MIPLMQRPHVQLSPRGRLVQGHGAPYPWTHRSSCIPAYRLAPRVLGLPFNGRQLGDLRIEGKTGNQFVSVVNARHPSINQILHVERNSGYILLNLDIRLLPELFLCREISFSARLLDKIVDAGVVREVSDRRSSLDDD